MNAHHGSIRDPRSGHLRAALILLLLSALVGCGSDDADRVDGSVNEVAQRPAGSVALPVPSTPPGLSRGAPVEPFVDRGVCPFECCLYREWEALAVVPVHAVERDTSAPAFSLAAGERFVALTGNVYFTTVGVAVVSDTLTLGDQEATVRLGPGDTVYVLSHRGEGTFNLLRNGQSFVGEGFWAMMPLSGRGAAGALVREPVSEWWVQVRNASGGTGWIDMNQHGDSIRGADACA